MTVFEQWTGKVDAQRFRTALAVLATIGLVLVKLSGSGHDPEQPTRDRGEQLGKSYAPAVLRTYADAWDVAATALAEGKTVAQAQSLLQETWKRERVRAFNEGVRSEFLALLPEGEEPADALERARVASFWKAFAKGLRSASISRSPVHRRRTQRVTRQPLTQLEFSTPD